MAAAVVLASVTWFVFFGSPDVSVAGPPRPIAVSTMPIIAVLPFANQTGDDRQDYFAEGVTDEVISALGRFNTLRVIGRNAVQRFKKRAPTQEEIAAELGANLSRRRKRQPPAIGVRIAAQLTEARARAP